MGEFTWEKVPPKAQPSNPAAGADFSYTVPAGYNLRISHICLNLTTDANVANRIVQLVINDGTTNRNFYISTAGANQTAGRLNVYNYGLYAAELNSADLAVRKFLMAPDIILPAGSKVLTSTSSIQAGDQFIVRWVAQERPL